MNAPGGDTHGYEDPMAQGLGNMGPPPGYLGNPALAGLTGQDIKDIFGVALEQQRYQDKAGIKQLEAMADLMKAQGDVEPQFVYDPSLGRYLSLTEFKALPSEDQQFLLHFAASQQEGGEDIIGARQKFLEDKPTNRTRDILQLHDKFGVPISEAVDKTTQYPPESVGRKEIAQSQVAARTRLNDQAQMQQHVEKTLKGLDVFSIMASGGDLGVEKLTAVGDVIQKDIEKIAVPGSVHATFVDEEMIWTYTDAEDGQQKTYSISRSRI
jgi:hypothetical protein